MVKRLLFYTLLYSICLLVGCTTQAAAAPEPVTLRVLTERTPPDGMNYQLEQIADAFMREHADVTVEIEYLSTDAEVRSLYLYQLRTEIMSGLGPDVYLLPTKGILYKEATSQFMRRGVTSYSVEPLFSDIQQAMENGVFQDVSTYYDSDRNLHTEALNQAVMDAGTVRGQRYVLPLRYNMPVLLANPDDPSIALEDDLSMLDLAAQAVAANDITLAVALQMPEDFSCLPRLFHYETGEVLLSQEDIAEYLKLYQQVCAIRTAPLEALLETTYQEMYANTPAELRPTMEELRDVQSFGLNFFCESPRFSAFSLYWQTDGFPIYTGDLCNALHNAAIEQYLDTEAICQPLCTANGVTTAEVTYFGAVGAGCRTPELAYAFLREFLTEEAQWDILRPRTDYSNADTWNVPTRLENLGFVENSWPVRTHGSVPYLWASVQNQIYSGFENIGYGLDDFTPSSLQTAKTFYNAITLTDEDLPILFTPIDEVRFPVTLPEDEFMAWALAQLNEEDGTPTDVDIDALAEQLHQNLWWHLAEG